MSTFLDTILKIIHIFVCAVLMFVVLLQQGKGGGMGAAFGGGGATQVFGGRGAGNILTRATAICAATFMLTSVALAARSSQRDRALAARQAQDDQKHSDKGSPRPKDDKAKDAPGDKPAADDKPAPEKAPEAPPASSSK
jgi:preprotein translocase subunit SecG